MTDAPDAPSIDSTVVTTTTRDMDATRGQFVRWLNTVVPGAEAEVHELDAPSANGMSSESLLVEASWNEDGNRTRSSLVLRVAPPLTAVPVFPSYDFTMQFGLLSLIASASSVPVPTVRWLETDPAPLGAPFFVMDRVVGRVPPDVMPYNMGSWLTEASELERDQLQRSTLEAIAGIHGIDPASAIEALGPMPDDALRTHVSGQRAYYEWMRVNDLDEPICVPLIERALSWLDSHWPTKPGAGVISWGDSRIGNILYDGFTPAAVLDWEMAGFAPREVDLAWCIFLHRFFEDIAATFELPGMPDFLRRSDVEATYAEITGHEPQNMDWHLVYAAVRHANVMSRVKIRAVHFGEAEMPDDLDDLIMHRAALESMLDGDYWTE